MRIALVTENFLPKLDGVTRTLAMLLEHLEREGHQAIVFGPEGSPRRYAGARVIGVPGVPLPFYPELRMLFPTPLFERRMSLFRPDLVHVVDPMILGAAGIMWAQRLNVPVVSSYHTNLAAYCEYFGLGALVTPTWAWRRFLHSQCLVTLCPSPSTAEALASQGFSNLGVWPRGVDGALFNPQRRSAAWRARILGADGEGDPATPIILYVGRLSHEKNLGALVSAFSALADSGACDARLVLVGDGPARGDLARSLDGRRVTFTGYLSGEALAEAYASADVFAFPSITETFGQVVQEAMASGLPVIGFDAEGIRDLVRSDETGLLAPIGDGAAFMGNLRRVTDDVALRARLSVAARAFAEQRTWRSVMANLVETYARALGKPALARVA